jgi:hypothetical protein
VAVPEPVLLLDVVVEVVDVEVVGELAAGLGTSFLALEPGDGWLEAIGFGAAVTGAGGGVGATVAAGAVGFGGGAGVGLGVAGLVASFGAVIAGACTTG